MPHPWDVETYVDASGGEGWEPKPHWPRIPWGGTTSGLTAGEWFDCVSLVYEIGRTCNADTTTHPNLQAGGVWWGVKGAPPTYGTEAAWVGFLTAARQSATMLGSLNGQLLYADDPGGDTVQAHMVAFRTTIVGSAFENAITLGNADLVTMGVLSSYLGDLPFLQALLSAPLLP